MKKWVVVCIAAVVIAALTFLVITGANRAKSTPVVDQTIETVVTEPSVDEVVTTSVG